MEPAIAIYIGDPVLIGSEIRALTQLDDDLQKIGEPAAIFANFEVGGRQIDCVVVTERQATMLDFKNLNGPVKGGVNGPWMLRDFGGAETRHEGENPYAQGCAAKFKLADALKEYHRKSGVGIAPDKNRFFWLFDAAVCVCPNLHPGSSVKGDFKCWVWGYPEALQQITNHLRQKITRSIDFSVFECESRKFLQAAGGPLNIADRLASDLIDDFR